MRVELLMWELLINSAFFSLFFVIKKNDLKMFLPFFHFFSYAIFFVLFFLVEPLRKKLHSVSHILSFRLSRVVVVALIKPLSPFERRRRTV